MTRFTRLFASAADVRALLVGGVALLAAASCSRPSPPAARAPAGERRIVASFTGVVDARAGTLTFERVTPVNPSALTVIPVVQDGVPGVGPDDTVELVTTRAAIVAGGCGAVDSFEGDVVLRSFYHQALLRNAYVEIVQITPTGREACNSVAVPPEGTSNVNGLFAYGDLDFAGGAGDHATATWKFRLPDTTRFTFTGRVVADVYDTSTSAPSATVSTVEATPATVFADGVATATLTATVKNDAGVPMPQRTVTFSVSGTGNVLSATQATTGADGRASVTLSSTVVETKTVTVVVGQAPVDLELASHPQVAFVAGPLSASLSTVLASPSSALADGSSPVNVTVTLADTSGRAMEGHDVALDYTGLGSVTPAWATTGTGGVASFQITAAASTSGLVRATVDPATAPVVLPMQPTVSFYELHTIGGTISALTWSGLVLATPGQPNLSVNAGATSFTFATSVQDGTTYDVTIVAQPTGEKCGVVSGSGTVLADVTSVKVWCVGWVRVSAGANHSVGIMTDGTLWAWGRNDRGQLGDGTTTQRNYPVLVGSGFAEVSAGTSHTVAVKTDGTLWAWGSNQYGQAGDGGWPDVLAPKQIGTGFTKVAAGWNHSIAIASDGSLWAWGQNTYGQLGDNSNTNRSTPVRLVSAPGPFTAVAAGANHSMALDQMFARVWTWGRGLDGQLGDGSLGNRPVPQYIPDPGPWTSIAAGADHSLGVKAGGALWAWGKNFYGQLGDGGIMNQSRPVAIAAGTSWSSVAAGASHTIGLWPDGLLHTWGSDMYGQLGNGSSGGQQPLPMPIAGGFAFADGGDGHTLAVKTDGTLWAWGLGTSGQLGDGTTAGGSTPAEFLAGDPSPATSTIAASPASVTTGDASQITVTVRDGFGNLVPGVTVTLEASGAASTLTQPASPTAADGTTSGWISATTPGARIVTARLPGGAAISTTATVTVVVGPPSASTSTLVASPTSVPADGTLVSLAATILDAFGNPISGATVTFSSNGPATFLQPPSTNSSGQTAGNVKSTYAGPQTISAVVAGNVIATAGVTFTLPVPDPNVSTVVASAASAPADGTTAVTVTVTVKTASNLVIVGRTVTLTYAGAGTVTPASSTTSASGVATFQLTSTAVTTGFVTASVDHDGTPVVLTSKPTVSFYMGWGLMVWGRDSWGSP